MAKDNRLDFVSATYEERAQIAENKLCLAELEIEELNAKVDELNSKCAKLQALVKEALPLVAWDLTTGSSKSSKKIWKKWQKAAKGLE